MVDVAICDASLRLPAVEIVAHDYRLDAPGLETVELRRMVGDVSSGRRRGLVGITTNSGGSGNAGERPVGLLLYRAGPAGDIAVDFLHVMRALQTSDLERQFILTSMAALAAQGPPEVTIEAFVAGTAAQTERLLSELGLRHYPRYLMACDLQRVRATSDSAGFAGGVGGKGRAGCEYRLLPWGSASHDDVARLQFAAHATRREPRMGGDTIDGALAQVISLARSKLFCPNISTLAMVGSTPIGMVMVTEATEHDLMIVEVAVAPDHQGQGVGRAIMDRTLHEAALAEAKSAWLVVNAANRPAVNLYRAVGFSVSRPVINCRWTATQEPAQ